MHCCPNWMGPSLWRMHCISAGDPSGGVQALHGWFGCGCMQQVDIQACQVVAVLHDSLLELMGHRACSMHIDISLAPVWQMVLVGDIVWLQQG